MVTSKGTFTELIFTGYRCESAYEGAAVVSVRVVPQELATTIQWSSSRVNGCSSQSHESLAELITF